MSFNINYTFAIAWQAIGSNKLRAMLTSLGIIFGVGSVISMLSVGKGAEQEILEQMKLLGANNIVVKPVIEQKEGKAEEEENNKSEKKKYTPGLTLEDARSIARIVPGVSSVSPEIITELTIVRDGLKRSGRVVGIEPAFFEMSDFSLIKGELFNSKHIELALPVCIIGNSIRTKFFATEDPIGKTIKCGNIWLTVIGVLDERKISEDNIKHLGIRDYNMDVYTPITTALLKFRNRSLITKAMINNAARSQEMNFGDEATDKQNEEKKNYNQLDRLTVRMASSDNITKSAEIITRMLERRHNRVVDFEVSVPELLLKQEQRTKTIFNIVLGAIASISLLVGGIGIMNIMLVSVAERTREIGIRKALGATNSDIAAQFIIESLAIGIGGGISGYIVGYLLAFTISTFLTFDPVLNWQIAAVALFISLVVGTFFGLYPAIRASRKDPIDSLREYS